jgi:ribosomal protein S18 acetylase RimI-like enzyme
MMIFSTAKDADLSAIAALVNSSYRGEISRQGWTTEADYLSAERTSESRLRADIRTKPDAALLLLRDEADGPILSCAWLEPTGDDIFYLGMLTVRPDLQDRQMGRDMLARAETQARERGARRIRMTVVHLRDKLIAWYERRGYRLTGERLPFDHGETGGPELWFVVLEKVL